MSKRHRPCRADARRCLCAVCLPRCLTPRPPLRPRRLRRRPPPPRGQRRLPQLPPANRRQPRPSRRKRRSHPVPLLSPLQPTTRRDDVELTRELDRGIAGTPIAVPPVPLAGTPQFYKSLHNFYDEVFRSTSNGPAVAAALPVTPQMVYADASDLMSPAASPPPPAPVRLPPATATPTSASEAMAAAAAALATPTPEPATLTQTPAPAELPTQPLRLPSRAAMVAAVPSLAAAATPVRYGVGIVVG